MKKNILFATCIVCILFAKISQAQTVVFHEDFETLDSMVSSGSPTWFQDVNYHTDGTHCMRDSVTINGNGYLTSIAFSTMGSFSLLLRFDQICKINFADQGYVEVSNDNGNNWITLNGNQYLGSSTYLSVYNYFSSFSYGPSGWSAANDLAIPQSNWWRTEVFDLSSLAANASQVKIRFRITDGNGNGNSGNYGWLLDHVSVQAAPHELIPPAISWSPPVLQGTLYNIGPFTISDTIVDVSSVDTATLYYTINGGLPVNVGMTNSGNIYHGIIPAVTAGDTVCYFVQASDTWGNTSVLPAFGCQSFIASLGVSIPYSDNFDVTNTWHNSTVSGSSWQLGTPAFGVTTGAHSTPNAWDIDLTSGYLNITTAYLISPIFNFLGTYQAELSFWRNHNCEASWDGVRVECTTNGTNWWVLGRFGDLRGTNWYNYATINSSGLPAFAGFSNGWVQSKYKLDTLNNVAGPVQFRFVFTSDPQDIADGFSIDDILIVSPSPHDVGVTNIVLPALYAPQTRNDSVKIVIHNFGSDTSSSFEVGYRINSGSSVTQMHIGTIQLGGNDSLIFSVPFLVPTGAYNICAWTSLVSDGNHFNDTTCKSSLGVPIFSMPYTNNFDTGTSVWVDSSALGSLWQLGTPNYSTTNSAYSSPNSWDINLNTAYGNNARSLLTSPFFDFTGIVNAKLSFWQNRNISSLDGLRLEYTINSGTTWNDLGTAPNDVKGINWYNRANINSSGHPGWDGNSNGWIKSYYILPSNITGTHVRFRFVFTSNNNTVSAGVSIDNFSIMPATPIDLSVLSFIQPAVLAPAGSIATVGVVLKNFGTTASTSGNIVYELNGVIVGIESWTGSLAPAGTTNFNFAASFVVPSGVYSICAYADFTADGDHSNDTVCKQFQGIPSFIIPYADNFDTGTSVWIDSSTIGSLWQMGTPNYSTTNSAYSTPNSWDINLNTAYGLNARSLLTSPFFNFTGVVNAKLSFWQNRNISSLDGLRLEYTINSGSTWNDLGTAANDVNGINWYNIANINGSGRPGWDGNSNGWIKSYYILPSNITGPYVRFRFVFTSNASVVSAGVSIDNFSIQLGSPVDMSVLSFIQPGVLAPAGSNATVGVVMKNFGTTTATSGNMVYEVNGVIVGTESWVGSLAPAATTNFNFTTAFVVPSGVYSICAYTDFTSDGDHSNDTACKQFQGTPSFILPYADNFDTGTSVWLDSSTIGSLWQLGTPNYGTTNSAHSSPNSWDINLSTAYGNNARSLITSPFFDFTGVVNAKLSFWQNRNISSLDGLRLEYTINSGTSWNVLGTAANDVNGFNWYNIANINSSGRPGWDGNSNGWIKSYYTIPPNITGPYVRFRFVFTSNANTVSAGVSIDDFSIQLCSPVDLSVLSFIQPGVLAPAGSNATVGVVMKNYGTDSAFSGNVSYVVNGVFTATESWTGSLAPAATTTYNFATTFVIPSGVYSICAYADFTSDGDHSNDTACKQFQGIPSFILPYADNFDTGTSVWLDSSTVGSLWQLGIPNYSTTNSAYSSPNSWDINLNTAYGLNARSLLTSPFFNFTGVVNAKLSFWQNRNISSLDGLQLEYTINSGTTWNDLGTAANDVNGINWYNIANINSSGHPGWDGNTNGWIKSNYILPPNITGPNVRFRFLFTSNNNTVSAGVSIDDFSIQLGSPVDVSLISIIPPGTQYSAGSNATVDVVLKNYGTDSVFSGNVSFVVNGVWASTESWTGSLAPAATTNFNFVTSFVVPSGAYSICAYVDFVSDGDHYNDTTCSQYYGRPRFGIPYTDNFDTGMVAWLDSSAFAGTNWEHGTPAFGVTTGAYSPPSCWDINLTTGYLDNARSYLISPLFDFSGIDNARLSFWQNRNTETGYDGMRLEYSINSGSTWATLGSAFDPNAINWYTISSLFSSNLPAWDNNSLDSSGAEGWQQSTYLSLPSNITGPNVMFRFVFTSDGSETRSGVSIDNFNITIPPTQDVGVTAIIHPGAFSLANQNDSVEVVIQNFGSGTTSNFQVVYSINAGSPVSQLYTGTIQPGAYDTLLFSAPFLAPPGTFSICAWTSLAADSNFINDTICSNSFGIPRFNIPYQDNFDTTVVVWVSSSSGAGGTTWQQGNPSFGQTTGAYSAPSCWDINLTSTYQNNAQCYLTSPLFDFTGATNVRLSFEQNRKLESLHDGMRLEYTINGGGVWSTLGSYNDPGAINWYNRSVLQPGGLPAWDSVSLNTSGSPGWQQSTYFQLPSFIKGSNVKFRFVFTTNASITQDGISVDNFRLFDPTVGIPLVAASADEFKIYPNPSSGIFYLMKTDWMENNSLIIITDVLGNEILNAFPDKSGRTLIDLSSKPNGIYFVAVRSHLKNSVQKIILCK